MLRETVTHPEGAGLWRDMAISEVEFDEVAGITSDDVKGVWTRWDDEWDWVFLPRADDQCSTLETCMQEGIGSKLDEFGSPEFREPDEFLVPVNGSPFQKPS